MNPDNFSNLLNSYKTGKWLTRKIIRNFRENLQPILAVQMTFSAKHSINSCNIIVFRNIELIQSYCLSQFPAQLVGLTEYLSVCLLIFCNVGKLSSEYQRMTCNSVGTFVCLATKDGQWLLGWLTTTEKETVTTQQIQRGNKGILKPKFDFAVF